MSKTVLFQPIQLSINTQFGSIWPYKVLPLRASVDLGAMAIKGVLHIPQSSSITGASPSDCLVSYPGYLLRESYPSAEMQSVYSTVPADWVIRFWGIQHKRWTMHKQCVLERKRENKNLWNSNICLVIALFV